MNVEVIQGTAEWKSLRAGKLTASRLSDALATTAKGWGTSRANLIAELVAERLTGVPAEGFTNAAMAWGVEKESDARDAYEMARNTDVRQVGFVPHPVIAMAGCSPDGLVGDVGMVEIKAPQTATHIETLLGNSIPNKYVLQMSWQLACHPERQWVDWVSYDPRLPLDMQLFIRRFDRPADSVMADLEQKARDFLVEVDAKVTALTTRFRVAA